MNKSLKIVIGFLVSLFCLWLVLRNIDFGAIQKSFSEINVFFVFLAIPVYIFAHLMRALRWKYILSPIRNASILDLFLLIMFGFLVNNVVPARAGEFARAVALSKRVDLEFPSALSSIILERFFDLIGILLAFCVGLFFFPFGTAGLKVILATLFLIAFGFLFLFFVKKTLSRRFAKHNWILKLDKLISDFWDGLTSLKSVKIVLGLLLVSFLIVGIEILNINLINRSFSLGLSFSQSLILYLGIVVGVAIPSSPGFIGTFELFGIKTLEKLGFLQVVALPFVLFLHFYYLIINSTIGLFYFVLINVNKKKITKESTT